jgi:hypothetical protein
VRCYEYDDRRLDQMTWRTNKKLRFPANVQFVDFFGKMKRNHYTRHMDASGKRLLSK